MLRPRRSIWLLASIVTFVLTVAYLQLGRLRAGSWARNDAKVPAVTEQSANRTTNPGAPPSVSVPPNLGFDMGPISSNHTKNLVIAKLRKEYTSWIEHEDLNGAIPRIYVTDDPAAPLHVPKNKGNEAMAYLTHMIDNYHDLADVTIFMHAHQKSWHQNGLLSHDAAETVRRLSSHRVVREGYMNLRCEWAPGCPAWMHPGTTKSGKPEEPVMGLVWAELFPAVPVPSVLAQPCCSQFAVSRERIQTVARDKLIWYRDWLLDTELSDEISGRIFEYLWQYIFTGNAVFCPNMHICACDGFGVCFRDSKDFDYWFELRWEKHLLEKKLEDWRQKAAKFEKVRQKGLSGDIASLELDVPSAGLDLELAERIAQFEEILEDGRQKAIIRGANPAARAVVAGRPWADGDGF
jgi:hypothetical protein